MTTANLEVCVTIAVSEHGMVSCCVANSNWLTQQRVHDKFMQEIRASKALHTVKTVRVQVPMPVQFEVIPC